MRGSASSPGAVKPQRSAAEFLSERRHLLQIPQRKSSADCELFRLSLRRSPCKFSAVGLLIPRRESSESLPVRRPLRAGFLPATKASLSRANATTDQQQPVEFCRMMAVALGVGDEDLPALFGKRASLGDCAGDAQPVRRRGIFTS